MSFAAPPGRTDMQYRPTPPQNIQHVMTEHLVHTVLLKQLNWQQGCTIISNEWRHTPLVSHWSTRGLEVNSLFPVFFQLNAWLVSSVKEGVSQQGCSTSTDTSCPAPSRSHGSPTDMMLRGKTKGTLVRGRNKFNDRVLFHAVLKRKPSVRQLVRVYDMRWNNGTFVSVCHQSGSSRDILDAELKWDLPGSRKGNLNNVLSSNND